MSRAAVDAFVRMLEAAYRGQQWNALRPNLEDIRPDEWHAKPARWDREVFGDDPELSIAELAVHAGGALFMYGNHAFGDASYRWGGDWGPRSMEMGPVLEWLDEGHAAFVGGVRSLADDSELAVERPAPWGALVQTERLIAIVMTHDVYHAGEINRQRSLLRGAEGWTRGEPAS